ncbi:hypothetical protein A6A08_19570 [Nocardiopsis sp. TSRI0078]|nr:hypothetical protein A6A08_19570 [Nocardiopsis sp. TSRI0078]
MEALAFFAEELLEPDEERTVASHIDTCATCAATLDELTGVGDVLAAAPAPEMPRDVADLLDRRIAEAVRERNAEGPAEAGADPDGEDAAGGVPVAGSASGGAAPSGATVVPLSRRRRRGPGFMPRLMMVAAAAVVIGGGGAAVFNGVLSPDPASDEAGVAAPLQEDGAGEAAPDTAQTYTPQVVRSGTVYTEASLTEQAALTLDRSPVGGAPSSEDAEPMAPVETAPVGVQECTAFLGEELGRGFTLVDDASYGDGGSRAWVLFAPLGERYEVYVVDPRCAQGGDTARSVLAQETVQAP